MIYAQILFYDTAARKSVGIYVNDEIMPIVECVFFDIVNGDSSDRNALYSQCSTMAYTRVNTNDTVFVKSLESGRAVILQKPLTFWGIVKQ